jgi:transposase
MFPRVKTYRKKDREYKYLVISESVYLEGKGSTTKDIAQFGSLNNFTKEDIENIIDGLIKIFKLETYALSEDVEMIETLEHGSILFWEVIWKKLGLDKIVAEQVHQRDSRITVEVEKYIRLMVINRCINPLSKLAVTRWFQTTNYKAIEGFRDLSLEVNYFYRSMDQLLKVKDKIEFAIFKRLKNLFSINVNLTFYDITSTFFYSSSCDLSENGYSRDSRADKEQIVIGVVTSYEGYPIKHYVFSGNTKDEKTVKQVVENLKKEYEISQTTFVGDRGMITKLNIKKIAKEGFNYIMGVKSHQDEICRMIYSNIKEDNKQFESYNDIKIREKKINIKDFLLWKIESILNDNEIQITENKYFGLKQKIQNLTNSDTLEYKDFKSNIKSISEEITDKISYKIFTLIKKYTGKYEDELRYVVCLNEQMKKMKTKSRDEYLQKLLVKLDDISSTGKKKKTPSEIEKSIDKIFTGYRSKYRKFFIIDKIHQNKPAETYQINQDEKYRHEQKDGIFILLTNRYDLPISKVVESYKNLQEVELLFDDLKNFVDIRPVRHWLPDRVRAHVQICIMSLLLKRVFEINFLHGKSVTKPLEEISKVKLVKYKVKYAKRGNRTKTLYKVTNLTPLQKKYFNLVDVKNPMDIEKFIRC